VTHTLVCVTIRRVHAIRVKVGPKGRVVVPAPIRRELGIQEGTELMARVEGEGIVLEPRSVALRRLQALVREAVPEGVSLVDELIAERREEARREEAELEARE
jgi:AbrB family looped-hinge helix DNA binding protein